MRKEWLLPLAAAIALVGCNVADDVSDLEDQLNDLQSSLDDTQAELDDTQAELDDANDQIDELNQDDPADPILGEFATTGANLLAENSDNVWRFAVFPDSQGRDDDNMKAYVCTDIDGNAVTDPAYPTDSGTEAKEVCEYIGVDFNKDGYYDAGTESQNDSVKLGDWDEDGISYLVNVQDPFQPYIETNSDGSPVIVAMQDRKDYGPDWKILPVPLVEAVTDKFIELDVDMVLAIGDYTEYRAESDYVQVMDKIVTPLTDAGINFFPVRGNHEIVNGRNWPKWFNNVDEWERQSVSNVPNAINPYEGYEQVDYDQGVQLYRSYVGGLTQEHLGNGTVVGFPGAEDLNYYFTHNNTLFIGLDVYFGELYSSAFRGTWIELYDWIEDAIHANAANVDHIVVFTHESLATKKRPQTFDAAEQEAIAVVYAEAQTDADEAEAAYLAAVEDGADDDVLTSLQEAWEDAVAIVEELEAGTVDGSDIGQLGHLLIQDESDPGLANKLLTLFADYQVTFVAGHDHQYSRSLIHPGSEYKDSAYGFTHMIVGNASWKAYGNNYGFNDEYETGLYIDNFVRDSRADRDDLYNTDGTQILSHTDDLGAAISFVLVEINGRQITTTSYYASHDLTEVDLNLGAYYDFDGNQWCQFNGDFMVADSTETTESCSAVDWVKVDENSRTTDAVKTVVEPLEQYLAYAKTPEGQGYLGSEASIIDGYNVTYDTSYADALARTESLRELLTMSWFVDENAATLSDVLMISGVQTQEGTSYQDDGYLLATSASEVYANREGLNVLNSTHVTRDGVMNKGTDIDASLSGDTSTFDYVDGESYSESWVNRYNDDGLDFADAMTLSFVAPEGVDIETLTVGRYNEDTGEWVPAFSAECFVETGYSEHYSVYYRMNEQEPEGGYGIDNCQQRYWGYMKEANVIWGFIHTDGKFAVIER